MAASVASAVIAVTQTTGTNLDLSITGVTGADTTDGVLILVNGISDGFSPDSGTPWTYSVSVRSGVIYDLQVIAYDDTRTPTDPSYTEEVNIPEFTSFPIRTIAKDSAYAYDPVTTAVPGYKFIVDMAGKYVVGNNNDNIIIEE